MKKWTIIIGIIVGVVILSYLSIKYIGHEIEVSVAYKHPIVKYNRTIKNNNVITMKSDTKVNISSGDMKLLPDGSYVFSNCTGISFTNSTSSTNVSSNSTVENGTNKPDLTPFEKHNTAGIGIAVNPFNAINEFGVGGSVILFNIVQINAILTQKNGFREVNSMVFIEVLF